MKIIISCSPAMYHILFMINNTSSANNTCVFWSITVCQYDINNNLGDHKRARTQAGGCILSCNCFPFLPSAFNIRRHFFKLKQHANFKSLHTQKRERERAREAHKVTRCWNAASIEVSVIIKNTDLQKHYSVCVYRGTLWVGRNVGDSWLLSAC